MKSGKGKKERNTTVRNFQTNPIHEGESRFHKQSCVYHSEANVTSSEGSLLLFQRSSAQRRYRGTTTILSHKKKKKKNG